MRTRVVPLALVLTTALAGCGAKAKPATTPADDEVDGEAASGGDVIPAERMDEIKATLDRKRTAAARCLADAVSSGKVPKNSHGHVALGFTISASGAAQDLKVLESTINSSDVEDCVMAKVQQLDFGALPNAIEWSYTFAFESM